MGPPLPSAERARNVGERRALLACAIALPCTLAGATAVAAEDSRGERANSDYSQAERAIFMSNHLANVRPPATLQYRYVRGGSLEPAFEDRVTLKLTARADRSCCTANADFLSGTRRLALPEVEAAEGNPVLLYFLERDIREMSRHTKGQAAYFRKRIRMAIYQAAELQELTLPYRGKDVAARRFTVAPYVDDPLRARFAKLAGKRYTITLSDAVPGGVYAVTTRVDAEDGGTPLWTEEMTLQ
jgi:hypothetical protein